MIIMVSKQKWGTLNNIVASVEVEFQNFFVLPYNFYLLRWVSWQGFYFCLVFGLQFLGLELQMGQCSLHSEDQILCFKFFLNFSYFLSPQYPFLGIFVQ